MRKQIIRQALEGEQVREGEVEKKKRDWEPSTRDKHASKYYRGIKAIIATVSSLAKKTGILISAGRAHTNRGS